MTSNLNAVIPDTCRPWRGRTRITDRHRRRLPQFALELHAWIEQVCDWEQNRRQGLDFALQPPEAAIELGENATAIDRALLGAGITGTERVGRGPASMVGPIPRVPQELGMARWVVAIGTRPRGSTFWADHGNGNPVIVGDAGDDKLAPITERAGTEVSGIHAPRIASGR